MNWLAHLFISPLSNRSSTIVKAYNELAIARDQLTRIWLLSYSSNCSLCVFGQVFRSLAAPSASSATRYGFRYVIVFTLHVDTSVWVQQKGPCDSLSMVGRALTITRRTSEFTRFLGSFISPQDDISSIPRRGFSITATVPRLQVYMDMDICSCIGFHHEHLIGDSLLWMKIMRVC